MSALTLPCIVPVAGVSYRQDVVAGVCEGDEVVIEREVGNEFDEHACAVRSRSGQLGYLPAALARRLVAGGDGPWCGSVDEVLRGRDTLGVRVRISADPGAGAAGVQAPDSGADSEDRAATGSDHLCGDEPAEAGAVAPTVRSRSGRVLGAFVRREGAKVYAAAADGVEVGYPEGLVEVG